MTSSSRLIGPIVALISCIALLVTAYYFLRDNQVGRVNQLKAKAEHEYYLREFLSAYKTYQTLMDTTDDYGEGAMINYANAAFMSSKILKGGLGAGSQGPSLSDTILNQIANEGQVMYSVLTNAKNKKIASMAFNQLGYVTVKGAPAPTVEINSDSVFLIALQNFRNALKRNPNNDSARYNYELLKKVVDYPETVMNKTRSLVAQQRYIEAANLLERSMERDVRLAKQLEYLQRIKAVAGIDTTYRRRL